MFFDEKDPNADVSEATDSPVVRAQIAQTFGSYRNDTEVTDAIDSARSAASYHGWPLHDTAIVRPTFGVEDRDLERPTEADLLAWMTDEEYAALSLLCNYPYYPDHHQSLFASESDPDKMFAAKFLKQRGLIVTEFGDNSPMNVVGVFYQVTGLGEEKARLRIRLQSLQPDERAALLAELALQAGTSPDPAKILHFPEQNNVA